MNERSSLPDMQALFGGRPVESLFGFRRGSLDSPGHPDIVVIGAPCATPYASVGPYCADAPGVVRASSGFPGEREHFDFDLEGTILLPETDAVDIGDITYSETDFSANRDAIRQAVAAALDAGAIPVVIGGDDSVPIPVLQAYEQHGPITVFQFDAHIDWRDSVNGETMGLSSNMRRASEMPWVTNMVQAGARGIGSARPSDRQDALQWGVELLPMRELLALGIDTAVERVATGSKVFINLDIDAMDPAVVPGVIGPAPGGFSYWQVVHLLQGIASKATIAGFSLVEFMPAADIGGRSALVAARLCAIVTGLISRQRHG